MIPEGVLREALKNVYDPELGVNIVDLGLVYGIEQDEEGKVRIDMTMTTPGCPLHESMLEGARSALEVFDLPAVDVNLVWEPPWTPEMMTLDGRRALGWG